MSELNKDKETAEGRKRALPEEASVSLRDQIPKKLFATLDDMKIGIKVQKMWRQGNADRAVWLERQRVFLKDWDEFLESTAEGPFEGSSSLHVPMPLTVCKAVHARFLQALIGIDPWFSLKPRREDAVERASMVSDLMQYTVSKWANYNQGCFTTLDTWIWDWVTTGCGILKLRWDCTYQSFLDVVTEMQPVQRTVIDDTGKEVLLQGVQPKEVEKKIVKRTWEGPLFEHRDNEDVLIIGGEGDPQRADAVIDRSWLTASELWTLVDRNVFDEDAVEEVIKAGKDRKDAAENSGIKWQRAISNGSSGVESESELDRYEILEGYLRVDVDESGINSDVVVWVHNRSGKLLRATYLNRINKSGERPYSKIDYHKRKGQTYGIGLVEIIHPLSVEMDAMHNIRIDSGIISNMPFFFYRPTSSVDPVTINVAPGVGIPLDDPQRDVYFPNLGNRTSFGLQEEMGLQTMVERLTGMNDMTLGVLTGAQGATRTATGARALLGESNANLDVYLRRLNLGWSQALCQLLHTLQQRIPAGLSFRVTGETGDDYWVYIKSQKDIEGDFDFDLTGNSANSNKSIQQETASQILQFSLNPLLIQTRVVSVGNIYEAYKNHLKQLGVKDISRYCTKPPDWQHLLSPEDEANRLLRGIPVPVTPEMDHEGFLRYFEEIKSSDELLGQFDKEQTIALAKQAQQHQAMMQALQQAQAQAANTAQMKQNSMTSANQAPPGMTAIAGAPTPNASEPG